MSEEENITNENLVTVMDQNGNPVQLTREEYAQQILNAAKENWDNIELLRQLAPQLLNDGFVPESLEIASRCCEISGGHIPDLYWRSAAQSESGLLDEAAAGFLEMQDDAAYPADQARAAMGLARVRAKQGNEEETESLLEWALNTDPDNPQYFILLFGYFNERQRPEEGLQKVHQYASKYQDKASAWRALMQIAVSQNDIENVKKFANEALVRAKTREKQDLLAEISWHYGQSRQPFEIINLLEPQVQDIKHPFALMNLAQAYAETGRIDESLRLLHAIYNASPENIRPMVQQKIDEITAFLESQQQSQDPQ